MKCVPSFLQCAAVSLLAIATMAQDGQAQLANEPMDFLDQPEGVLNCVVSGTANSVPWDHRFTYWLSGVAQFDDHGNMLPVSAAQGADWLLTVTNSRFSHPTSYDVTVVAATPNPQLRFAFPAVSQAEWLTMGRKPTAQYAIAFSSEESAHGLYLAIRNTQGTTAPRQMIQVVHYLSPEVVLVSESAPCFLGPRPPAPSAVNRFPGPSSEF